ncbi:tetratricopeptide repeat-containing sensor histidine kinase [Limnovirga soli]|uniref:histidine kinase n=1 Tax=Limnovirga soli TaxID=2656915 RepID=A0A8J8FCF8_9BACT|nr:sensor histidine kinase [Limnovirga soli]NNV55485.1 hypothetical protein [Limnovirga soli]
MKHFMFAKCIIVFATVSSFLFTLPANGQKARYDSLQIALNNHPKEDAKRLNLLNELSETCKLTLLSKFDSGIICANKAIVLSKKLSDNKALAKAYCCKAEIFTRKGRYIEADSLIKSAITLNSEQKNSNGIGDCSMVSSLLHGVQGDFTACKVDAVKALKIYNSTKYKFGIANATMFIGYIYKYTGVNDTAFIYFRKADSIFLSIGNEYKPAFVYVDIAHMYVNDGQTKEAMSYLLLAQKYYEKDKNLPGLAMVYSQMANVYNNLQDDKMEMECILKGLRISEQMNNLQGQADCLQRVGSKLSHMNEYTSALQYFQKALVLAKAVNESEKGVNGLEIVITSYTGIGSIALENKEPKKALVYFDSALTAAKKLKFDYRLASVYDHLGDACRDDGNYVQSFYNYRQSISYSEKIKSSTYLSGTLESLGKLILITPDSELKKSGIEPATKFQTAEAYLLRALEITKNDGSLLLNQRLALHELSKLYEQKIDYRTSLAYLKEYIEIQDTLINAEKAKGITSQQIQFETEKKEQEIISLNKDKVLQEQQLENQKIIRNASVGGIILLLILIAVIINRYKLKRSIAMERMQQRISSDLHDDIGASLTSINILSQLSQQQKIDAATRNEYLQKMNEQTTEVTNALRDIVWSINPKNNKLDIILGRMKRYAAELLETKNIDYSFEANIKPGDEITDADIRQNIYLIFKESVNNLAKYSGATKAIIKFNKEANQIQLDVKDNGNGFDAAHITKGNGIENMQRRAKMINAKFILQSAPGSGTNISVTIPL